MERHYHLKMQGLLFSIKSSLVKITAMERSNICDESKGSTLDLLQLFEKEDLDEDLWLEDDLGLASLKIILIWLTRIQT